MNTKESKPWYKKWWVWLIIVIILIGAGGAAGNKDKTATNSGSASNSTETKKVEEKTEFKVGEAASFDNKTITVTDVQRNYDTGNQFAQPESGKEFVIVTVKITNDSDKTD